MSSLGYHSAFRSAKAAVLVWPLIFAGCSNAADGRVDVVAGTAGSGPRDTSSAGAAGSERAGAGNGGAAGSEHGGAQNLAGSNSGSAGSAGSAGKNSAAGAAATGTWEQIPAGTSWQWQLTGKVDTSVAVKVYDLDLYDVDAATVSALHAKGIQVICYVSVGSYEDWRPDAADFPPAILGKDYPDWPGERFLDIRALDKLGPIMEKRLDLCAAKGFDGVEPDNMDVFEGGSAGTGFPLTEKDGLSYAKWLTEQAHARGLSIGQKNTSELATQLASVMDWALTEDCFDGNWCSDMQPYIARGKAVLMSEYTDTGVNFGNACKWAKAQQFSAILKDRDLSAPVQFCP